MGHEDHSGSSRLLLPAALMLVAMLAAFLPVARPRATVAQAIAFHPARAAVASARVPPAPAPAPARIVYSAASSGTRIVKALHPRYIVSRSPQSVLYRVPTTQHAVFITIDDGWTRDARVVKLVRAMHLPITAFLVQQAADQTKQIRFFRALRDAGASIQDHTIDHPVMPSLSVAGQRRQICHTARAFRQIYGRQPTMFRPPYGAYNATTLRAAAYCGMGATFMWSAEMRSRHLSFAHRGGLQPGDIVLFHFRPELYDELRIFLSAARAHNLGIGSLQDFIRFGPKPPTLTIPEPVPNPVATLV